MAIVSSLLNKATLGMFADATPSVPTAAHYRVVLYDKATGTAQTAKAAVCTDASVAGSVFSFSTQFATGVTDWAFTANKLMLQYSADGSTNWTDCFTAASPLVASDGVTAVEVVMSPSTTLQVTNATVTLS